MKKISYARGHLRAYGKQEEEKQRQDRQQWDHIRQDRQQNNVPQDRQRQVRAALQGTAQAALALFYPPVCALCGRILAPDEQGIHRACEKKLVYVREPVCLRCGKPIHSSVQEYCFDCTRTVTAAAENLRLADEGAGIPAEELRTARLTGADIDGGIAVFVYTKEMSESMSMLKYAGKTEIVPFYVRQAADVCGDWVRLRAPDCITAVPMNRRKQRGRGFNQAQLLADGIGRALALPVDERLLVRFRQTVPQKELDNVQRMRNLQKAFGPGPHCGDYQSVLLVDDIYTTGSTMKACAQVLKKNGVHRVWCLSLCIGSDR